MTILNEDAIRSALRELPGWSHDADRKGLFKSFRFADFSQAFGFMARAALAAEKADHHPDWANVWNRVDVLLTTHSEGGVTDKDVAMARRMEELAD